jgi:23S rRNA pseudouridine1911/1915/1917 synthase
MPRRFEIGIDDALPSGERVDKVLARLMPETTRAAIQRWIAEARVLVDGASTRAKAVVRPGAIIEVEPGPPPASSATPDPSVFFEVLHEDEHLIVVNKPAGLVVHPARGNWTGTLVNGLLARPGFERMPADPRDEEGHLRPGIVHRLDKDTSGVLVVAKDEPTREGLKKQLSEHTVQRRYVAITCGVPTSRTLRTLHGRHPVSRMKFTSKPRTGKEAVTHIQVLETFAPGSPGSPGAAGMAAWVECRLETGRTHQIRVHLSEQTRTPILGDALYGGIPRDPRLREIAQTLARQALHAKILGFVHPVTGESLCFEAAPPADMSLALDALRSRQ